MCCQSSRNLASILQDAILDNLLHELDFRISCFISLHPCQGLVDHLDPVQPFFAIHKAQLLGIFQILLLLPCSVFVDLTPREHPQVVLNTGVILGSSSSHDI